MEFRHRALVPLIAISLGLIAYTWLMASLSRCGPGGCAAYGRRLSVSARREEGATAEVRIRAARAGEVRVRDPFEGVEAAWSKPATKVEGQVKTFLLRAGETVVGRRK